MNTFRDAFDPSTKFANSDIPRSQLSIWAAVAFKEACADLGNEALVAAKARMATSPMPPADAVYPAPTVKQIRDRAMKYMDAYMLFMREAGVIEVVDPEPASPKLRWGI